MVLMIVSLVLTVVLTIWTAQDAPKHGKSGVGMGILVFFLGIIGWLIYLATRGSVTPARSAGAQYGDASPSRSSKEPITKSDREQVEVGGYRHIEKPGVLRDDIFE